MGRNKKRSRHIPTDISRRVQEQHYFECAWCGHYLTERHHIKPFSLGGEHNLHNLILLCPNHHRMAHQKKIDIEELKRRKSTHLQQDRISGGFRTTLGELVFKLANNFFVDVKHLIAYQLQPVFSVVKRNEIIFISTAIYDIYGSLIFWMRENDFWAPSYFTIENTVDSLVIKNTLLNQIVLSLQREDSYINVFFNSYIDGRLFTMKTGMLLAGTSGVGGVLIKGCTIGVWIADNSLTEDDFVRANDNY